MFRLVVLSVVLAVATATPSGIWGGLASPLTAGIVTPLAVPIAAPLAAVAPIGAYNYRGPLSLAPGQPANILAADGRPLDTLSVNQDRAIHITAKALEGGHLLKKRSIVGAPLIAASLAATPLLAAPLAAVAPIGAYNYRGPLSLAPGQPANILAADGRPLDTISVNQDRAIHITAKALEGGHLLKKRSIVGAPLVAAPLAATPLVAAPLARVGLIGAPLTAPAVAVSQSSRIDIPTASVIASAPLAIAAAAPIAPLGLGHGAALGRLW